jgi:hypothetical protein
MRRIIRTTQGIFQPAGLGEPDHFPRGKRKLGNDDGRLGGGNSFLVTELGIFAIWSHID